MSHSAAGHDPRLECIPRLHTWHLDMRCRTAFSRTLGDASLSLLLSLFGLVLNLLDGRHLV